jgi:hypothetical protein
LPNNNLDGLLEDVSNQINKKEEEKKKNIERIENEINIKSKKNNKEQDFDNCNVYLKETENTNNFYSRKRSAMRFIENTIDKNNQINLNIINTTKSSKDPINDKAYNMNSFNNVNNTKQANNFSFKNSITSTNALNNQQIDKKEFQSRRKNQTNNILNDLENPKVVDINLNTNNNNKVEIDHYDHSLQNNFRKNFQKEMVVADNSYTANNKKEHAYTNTTRSSSNSNNNIVNINTNNDQGLGLFNSRRQITNTTTLNSLTNSNLSNSNNKSNLKDGNKDKHKFLII